MKKDKVINKIVIIYKTSVSFDSLYGTYILFLSGYFLRIAHTTLSGKGYMLTTT